MKEIRDALHAFWSGFYDRRSTLPAPVPIPAYQSGYAVAEKSGKPVEPPFPYITFEVARPETLDFTVTTANIWDRNPNNPGWHGLVDDVLAQVSEKIPMSGTNVRVGKVGVLTLYRSNPFIHYLNDPDDQAIVRGIVRVIIKS